MARPRRIMPAGYVYHVLNRGNERHVLFEQDEEYQWFLDLLEQAARRFAVRFCGIEVMPTHWHLLLWPCADNAVSACLHWITTAHSSHYRRVHDSVGEGHVYQARFHSFAVQTEGYYYNALRYVEANAKRAGLVSRAEDWRWSSLHERLRGSTLIHPGPLVLPCDWVEMVNLPQGRWDLEDLRACVGKGRPYGSEQWVADAVAAQALDQALRGRGRPLRRR